MRAVAVIGAALVALAVPAQKPAAVAATPAKRALVTWTVAGETFRTYVRSAKDIRAIRSAIRSGEPAGIPVGRVFRGTRENRGHRWHLRDVRLAEATIEVCDGRPSDLDADLDYWVESVKRYCPWSARPVRLRWVSASRRGHGAQGRAPAFDPEARRPDVARATIGA